MRFATGHRAGRRRLGISLVELLVVVAILGTLVGLLVPAVEKVRETAGRLRCQSNLRQLALAASAHQMTVGYFPSGGWGWQWVGVPDRGVGRLQPGGWAFSLLPYLEQQALFDMAQRGGDSERRAASSQLVATPLPFMNCPVRRRGGPYGNEVGADYRGGYTGTITPQLMARTDYAANAGSQPTNEVAAGPQSLAEGDTVYPWITPTYFTGVIYVRSETRPADVTKGLSQVYLIGEKYLNPASYDTGTDPGDNESMYAGFANDVNRVTFDSPRRDLRNYSNFRAFGSSHPGGLNMAMCDGSVRTVEYAISPPVFRDAGDRR